LLRRAKGAASPARTQRARIASAPADGFDGVAIPADEISPPLVAFANSLGLAVRAWRVRTPEEMVRVLAAGVNAMTLDDPDPLVAHLLATTLRDADGAATPA
jgi:glycerophosphoryl diester phosphodiesterase